MAKFSKAIGFYLPDARGGMRCVRMDVELGAGVEGASLPRQSELNARHRALGSELKESWNNMPIAQSYATDPYDEIEATRYRAGMIDVSALQITNVAGPDATACLDYLLTTDITKLVAGQSHISNIVNDEGALIDDVLVYCDGPNAFRVSHGGGTLRAALADVAAAYDVTCTADDDVHILSVQGPKALDILDPHTAMDLSTLGYFTHQKTTLFDRAVSLARGGYSGERGYEVFCARKDAVALWDSILDAGKAFGILPTSWNCLDIGRVEAGLLFFPFDMPHGDTTPWEVRADWTVDLGKKDFRGRSAVTASKGRERSFITGLEVMSSEAVTPSAKVTANGQDVGVVTSTTFSRHLMKSIAMAQIAPSHTALGTKLEILDGDAVLSATVVAMPFYDPMRLRTHPLSERNNERV